MRRSISRASSERAPIGWLFTGALGALLWAFFVFDAGLPSTITSIVSRAGTRPDDRVLATWFAPEMSLLAGRGFAGRMVVFFGAQWSEPRYQRQIVERLEEVFT